jgi:hypothetical protein
MNRIHIDRLDLSLGEMDGRSAETVRTALPGALQRTLARRLAAAGANARVLDLSGADLGTLDLPAHTDPHAAATAIAERLADWLDVRLGAGT